MWNGSVWEEQETVRVEAPLMSEEIGVRVRRGPSWKWGDQDGGPGSTGVTTGGSPQVGWVQVRWDCGVQANYRVGADGAYDLSVVQATTTTPTTTSVLVLDVRSPAQRAAGALALSAMVARRPAGGRPLPQLPTEGGTAEGEKEQV